MGCDNSKISTANSIVLGAIQIMIGIFHVFMWYFLIVLYMGQIKGVFGTYEPLTYKTATPLWGIFYIISGVFTIKSARLPTRCLTLGALSTNVVCLLVTAIAEALTIVELLSFRSVSYKNYGQAKLGREVSRILVVSNFLEFVIALTYAICSCLRLGQKREENPASVSEEDTL